MVRNRRASLFIGGPTLLYGLLYLYAIGDLDLGTAGWGGQVLDWQWESVLARRGPWQFEAVAMFELGYLVLFVSPLNLLIAGVLAVLLALNLHGALALQAQAKCSRKQQVAASAGVWPALLAGGACCAPSLLLVLGIPGLGAFIGLFAWLLPLSLTLLVLSRGWQRRHGAPSILGWF
ncbi:hypothetical protein ACM71K_30320 [Pseudomonas aeruginosa]